MGAPLDLTRLRDFVLRRLLYTIALLWGVITVSFALLQLVPGDFTNYWRNDPNVSQATLDAMIRRFGLDRPWLAQYGLYLKNICLHLDFGISFVWNRPVFSVLREGLLNTLLLQSAAALVTWGLAIPLGMWAAVRQHSWVDKTLSLVAFLGLSIPEVLLALLLLMFAATTGLFPVGGLRSLDWESLPAPAKVLDILWHLALPALVVGVIPLAARMRQMRSSLLDVLRLEYVTTARAKGLSERMVLLKHALRNALNPLITLFGLTIAALISGSLVAEIVFGWPGVGRITFEALGRQDQYLAFAGVLMVSTMLVVGNLIADVLLAIADPRIAFE